MAKYNKRIVKRITDLIKADSYTISEICSLSGIDEATYYRWKNDKSDFCEAVEKARKQFDDILVKEAKNSLRKLVQGYDVEERKTVYVENQKDNQGKPKIKEQTVTKKHYQPSVPAVIFALTNKAPEEYKNRQFSELVGKDGKDLFAQLSDEELNKKIAEFEKKLGK